MTSQSALDTLINAAILAPSGDNTQPWKFTVDRDRQAITIDVNPTRDPSPMNAGQRMAWIAVGAAIENMVHTAESNGWPFQIRQADDSSVQIKLEFACPPGPIDPLLAARVTNRRVYQGGEIPTGSLERLRAATSEREGVATHWIIDRRILDQFRDLIARADALILGTKPIRDAFLDKVRFDQPANAVVDEGLSLGSLEATLPEQLALRVMRYLPDGVLRPLGGQRIFAGVAKKLAASASGMCLISSTDESNSSRIAVGRLWQQAWLRLTEEGLAAQPMMSLLVLQNIKKIGSPEIVQLIGPKSVDSLLYKFDKLTSELTSAKPCVLMRFGYAKPPTSRTGRLENQVTQRMDRDNPGRTSMNTRPTRLSAG